MSDLGFGFYTPEVLAHFQHPHHAVPVENPDAIGEVGNIACGDMLRLTLKITPKKPSTAKKKKTVASENLTTDDFIITDIGFQTYGCAAAIATSSITTDLALGQTLSEALKITKDQVVKELTTLPPTKIHCSILAVDALGEAIYQFLVAQKIAPSAELAKRHQQVEAAQTLLEQRYKEWGL